MQEIPEGSPVLDEIVWRGSKSALGQLRSFLWTDDATSAEVQPAAGQWISTNLDHSERELIARAESRVPTRDIVPDRYAMHDRFPAQSDGDPNWVPHETLTYQWTIAMTSGFRKAISNVDKRLQGRVLEAISDLCAEPMQSRGDTVRPLGGERKGRWRYRVGDWRLVYQPDAKSRVVFLADFAPRGGVYD